MAIGIRIHELRKTYHSAPPFGPGGGGFAPRDGKRGKQPPKPQIAALDGFSLEVAAGEIFGLLGQRCREVHNRRRPHHARAARFWTGLDRQP